MHAAAPTSPPAGTALTRDERVRECLGTLTRRKDFPAFSASISEVMRTVDDEDSSASHITRVILRDVGLTAKILRTVNSLYYNKSGREIRSVGHAVAMLGAEAVRNLAGSMVLVEHFHRKSAGVRELMMLSLITANHTRCAAEHSHYPRLEEAYLCGMFRNLGELLIACYLGEEYRRIVKRVCEPLVTEKQACLSVMGFSYEDLGRAMIRYWRMPEPVVRVMGDTPEGLLRKGSDLAVLLAVTRFGHELTTAMYRKEPIAARTALAKVLETSAAALGLRQADIDQLVTVTLEETAGTLNLLNVGLDDLRLRRQAEVVLTSGSDERAAPPAAGPDLERLAALTAKARGLVKGNETSSLNDEVMAVLEAVQRGGGFARALFAIVDPGGNMVRGRLGAGDEVEKAVDAFEFPLTLRAGPVARAMILRQDVFVSNDRDGRYEQSALVRKMAAGCFGLYPVVVEGKLVGCLYFDHPEPRGEMEPELTLMLVELRSLVAAAIERARAVARREGATSL